MPALLPAIFQYLDDLRNDQFRVQIEATKLPDIGARALRFTKGSSRAAEQFLLAHIRCWFVRKDLPKRSLGGDIVEPALILPSCGR